MTPTFDALWPTIAPLTLLHRYKAKLVYDALTGSHSAGDAVECGVFRGGMVVLMAKVLGQGRRVVAYDGFQGLPDDRSPVETEHYRPGHMVHTEVALRNTLREHGVEDAVDVVPGWFSDTMKDQYPRPVSLVHVDCDMYNGTKACIDHLYDALLPGGVMVFDDYLDQGGGVQAAVDELLDDTNDLLRAGYGDQAYVVKGWRALGLGTVTLPSGVSIEVSRPAGDDDYLADLAAGKLTGELPGGTLASARRIAERVLAQCDFHDAVFRQRRDRP